MKTLNPLAIELYTIFYQYPDRKVVYRYNNTLEEANDILSRLTDHQKELQIPGTNPSYYDNPLPN